jgi:hypothetical protein
MSVERTPKLYFHGTAALPAYLSYKAGRQLVRDYVRKPQATLDLIGEGHRSRFKSLGPAFPYSNATAARRNDVCLTRNIAEAYSFSAYEGSVYEPGEIVLTNSGGSRVKLRGVEYAGCPEAQQFLMRVMEDLHRSNQRNTFPAVGAILIIDGPKLDAAGCLIGRQQLDIEKALGRGDLGEEIAKARYLPWNHIRGILFTDPAPPRIGSFWFRDNQIQQDLREYLHWMGGFKPGIMTCEQQLTRGPVHWHKHLEA